MKRIFLNGPSRALKTESMRRLITFLLLVAVMPLAAQEYDYKEDVKVKIWDNESAPHSNELTVAEAYYKGLASRISQAELYVFKANPAKATGQAVLICPGGAYEVVSMVNEGVDVARWLAENGITCGVLKYRMPNGHREVPLEDAVEAMRIMRQNAATWNFDAEQLGVMGFSAGGHLAACVSNLAPAETKPAFSILMYAVITAHTDHTHIISVNNLLGEGHTAIDRDELSMENRVTTSTPPALLILSSDDRGVSPLNSTLYYNALKKHKIEAAMHIYPTGNHGWGMNLDFPYREQWQAAVLDWLKLRAEKSKR